MTYATEDKIKIYIGTDVTQMLAATVLIQSIKENTQAPVVIKTLENLSIPEPNDIRQTQRTQFSFARWALPELSDYRGRAIYLDADMLVFSDIQKLWSNKMSQATISIVNGLDGAYCSKGVRLNKNESSVMLIDCSRANWTLSKLVEGLDGDYDYHALMSELCFLKEMEIDRSISRTWNSMDHWAAKTDLLHFTNVPTQPWVYVNHPYGYIWVDYLKKLIHNDKIKLDFVKSEIKKGYVRPSLMTEIMGKTARNSDEVYCKQLQKIDKKLSYQPHKAVKYWEAERRHAVLEYERKIELSKGVITYLRWCFQKKIFFLKQYIKILVYKLRII